MVSVSFLSKIKIVIFWLLFLIFFAGLTICFFVKMVYPIVYKNEINLICEKYNIDRNLVYAIIKNESAFDEAVVSSKWAIGLMQLMPSTAEFVAKELNRDFDLSDLNNPLVNVEYGVFYLNYLFKKYKMVESVLYCYNAGEGNYLKLLAHVGDFSVAVVDFSETKSYIKKVLADYEAYNFFYRY